MSLPRTVADFVAIVGGRSARRSRSRGRVVADVAHANYLRRAGLFVLSVGGVLGSDRRHGSRLVVCAGGCADMRRNDLIDLLRRQTLRDDLLLEPA